MKNVLLPVWLLLSIAFCPSLLPAQNQDPFLEMQQRMNETFIRMRNMHEQLMQQGLGRLHISPDGDSSFYYFHIDTTFSGDGPFQFAPLDDGGMGGSFFFEGDDFFRDFFDADPFERFFRPADPRADDGSRAPDDGLLPEERLRMEESRPLKSPEKKKKFDTIRI